MYVNHFQVLETALSTIVSKFYRQLSIVDPLLEGLITDTVSDITTVKVGRLSALKKSLFGLNQSVQAIINALKELLANNRDMADLYLDKGQSRDEDDHEEIEFLLEAYVADLAEIEMKSTIMIAQIEDTMEQIGIHLNSRRNQIIRMSLMMETLAVTTGVGAVIGSVFGMNLLNGMESHPSAFYFVTGGTAMVMSTILTGFLVRYRHLILTSSASVEYQQSALKHFFLYIEAIEARIRLTDSISRKEFENIVTSVVGHRVDPKEIDFFFKVIDGNQNNRIELSELPPWTLPPTRPAAAATAPSPTPQEKI